MVKSNRILKGRLDFKEPVEDPRPCCPDSNIIEANGVRVCMNCGTVIGKQIVNNEKRVFSFEDAIKKKTTEKRWRDMGPRTCIGRNQSDSRGRRLNAKKTTKFNRLDKIQRSLIGSLERNMWEARPKLESLTSKLIIPPHVKETAWRIYIECAKQKMTMGRSIIAFIAASVYAAIRIHELPKMFDEVCDTELVQKRNAHQALGLIIKQVFPILRFKYRPITSRQLVYRYGTDLDLPMNIQWIAGKIMEKAYKNGLNIAGKDPRGIAASALYMAAKRSFDDRDRRTQAAIAEIAKITEVTLRSRIRDLKKFENL